MVPGFSLTAPSADFLRNPHPVLDELRRSEPVHHWAPQCVFLSRYADVLAVYRSPASVASSDKQREFSAKFGAGSPLFEHHTTSLVFNDPPLHTRVRRILMGALSQRAITRMQTDVQELVDGLLDALPGRVDLIEHFAAQIPIEVVGNLLAVPRAERGPLREWSLAILSALEPAPSPTVLARGHAAVNEFTSYLRELVAQRRRQPGDPEADVLTHLIQGDSQGQLSEAELLHNCIFLLNAGHETTTNLIGNGVHALLGHREQLERLQQDPGLINSAVEELLRYESPIQLNNRLTLAPLALSDCELPAGLFVTLGIAAANRDAAQFPDPHRLDITRKPNNHLAFGQGAHACSGMNVARLEARIALGALVQRFPNMELAGPPQRDQRLRFRGFKQLPVRLG
jgi:cytochrome P450